MTDTVKRYDPAYYEIPCMDEWHGGDYVEYEDYKKLEDRLAEALNQLDSTRHSVDVLERRVGELKAKLKGTNK